MAVKIRLTRAGAKKKPFYRVVAVDSREKRDGKYIELLGTYNPLIAIDKVKLDEEKVTKWLKNGAIPTETVRILLSDAGILKKLHDEKAPKAKKGTKPVAKAETPKAPVKKAETKPVTKKAPAKKTTTTKKTTTKKVSK